MLALVIAYAVAALVLLFCAVLALLPVTVIAFCALVWLREWVEEIPHEGTRDVFTLALVPLVVCFVLLDVAFNVTWGSYYFREWPKRGALLFTSRVEQHYRTIPYTGPAQYPVLAPDWDDMTHQQQQAVYWAEFLNGIDPWHVTMAGGKPPQEA